MKTRVISVVLTAILVTTAFAQGIIKTRFGTLTINNDKSLLFQGRPVKPQVEGNNALSFVKRFQLGSKDLVLLENVGGSACPYLYRFVTVSATGAKVGNEFGTCGVMSNVMQSKNSIVMRMPGYRGPFEEQEEKDKAGQETHTFTFSNGKITETVRTEPPKFNPFTSYNIIGRAPKNFGELVPFTLEEVNSSKGKTKVIGYIFVGTYDPSWHLKQIKVSPQYLSFVTENRRGVSFSFSGRYLQKGNLRRFIYTPDNKKVPILEGIARRFVNGKQKSVAKLRFYGRSDAG